MSTKKEIKIIEKGYYYQSFRLKFKKNYFTHDAKKLVKNYWRFHFKYLIDHDKGRVPGPINEDGLCQCVSLENFRQQDLRFFLFVSTFFDQLIYTYFEDLYSEFRETYNFPKIFAHGSPGMATPDWFLQYDRFDYEIFEDESWKYVHKDYWITIRNNFEIILIEILQFFSTKNIEKSRLILHIKLYCEELEMLVPGDGNMLNKIMFDFLSESKL